LHNIMAVSGYGFNVFGGFHGVFLHRSWDDVHEKESDGFWMNWQAKRLVLALSGTEMEMMRDDIRGRREDLCVLWEYI
jgi:hypothetical protein